MAIQFPEFPENPWNNDYATYSDCVLLFFTEDAPIILKPSFAAGACAGVSGYSTTHPGYWNGVEWVLDSNPESGSFNSGQPTGGTWAWGSVQNGTMFIEYSLMRYPKETKENGLRLEDGTPFRMGLMLMRLGGEEHSPDARGIFLGPHDAYPGDGYTPDGDHHPETWLRFRMPDAHASGESPST